MGGGGRASCITYISYSTKVLYIYIYIYIEKKEPRFHLQERVWAKEGLWEIFSIWSINLGHVHSFSSYQLKKKK